jgi:hypothetical protein
MVYSGHNWQWALAFAFTVRLIAKFWSIVKGPVARENPDTAQLFFVEKRHSSTDIKCIIKPVDLPQETVAFQGVC